MAYQAGAIIPAAIQAGASSSLSLSGNIMSYRAARKAREQNEKQANSAHQREVADLRAAGLNPILSADGGNGAQTPINPVPEYDMSGAAKHIDSMIGNTVATAGSRNANQALRIQTALANGELQLKNSAAAAHDAQAASSLADVQLKMSQLPNIESEIAKRTSDISVNTATKAEKEAATTKFILDAETERLKQVPLKKDEQMYNIPIMGSIIRLVEKAGSGVNSAVAAGATAAALSKGGKINDMEITKTHRPSGTTTTTKKRLRY